MIRDYLLDTVLFDNFCINVKERYPTLKMKILIRNLIVKFMNRNDFSNQKIAVTSIAVRTFLTYALLTSY